MKLPPEGQLLKWIGNKQRSAMAIVQTFPPQFRAYHEPFLGSGAVLATLEPAQATASDVLAPLIDIWQLVQRDPAGLLDNYQSRFADFTTRDRREVFLQIRANYNENPNGHDLLFLARTGYGGVIRFDRHGHFTTPCGPHKALAPEKFAKILRQWQRRVQNVQFLVGDFEAHIDQAQHGDLVYCDPPYRDCQRMLYGAQAFSLQRLFQAITRARDRGVHVALSIDGSKRSGDRICDVPIPPDLFAREAEIQKGRSMLRRFQMQGHTLHGELVADRLLCTW